MTLGPTPAAFACSGRLLAALVFGLLIGWQSLVTPLRGDEPPAAGQDAAAAEFDQYFVPETMRVDYFHTGNFEQDRIALDRVLWDGVWAGPRSRLTDTLDLGQYRFEVRSRDSQRLLFASGFCGVFGEWQTTAEAKSKWGVFHASLRFPWPREPVQVRIDRRVAGAWRELWTTDIDPDSRFVFRPESPPAGDVWEIFTHGDPSDKVDIVLLGDGYTRDEMGKFHEHARRLTELLFEQEPMRARRHDFNVRAVDVPAAQSGVTNPRAGVFRASPLGCQYNAFDLDRYVLTLDNRAVRDHAAAAPYDYLILVLNSTKYGGGGIFHDQMTVAGDHPLSGYIMVHEFGHHFAGLGDEYYVSNVAYETGLVPQYEPWEPNVTALLDPQQLKWQELVAEGIPIPTPWNKEAYELAARQSQSRREAREAVGADDANAAGAVREEQRSVAQILSSDRYAEHVGAFEGAAYEATGLYRPAMDCLMFSRNPVGFCPVCRRAIERMIDHHVTRP